MSVLGMFLRAGANGFGYNTTAEQVTEGLDLTGKTVLITGVSSGLGQEAMRVLALRGAHVFATARTAEKAAAAAAGMKGTITPFACELADPASVRACVAAVRATGVPLDAIIANAGIMALPQREVAHGIELQLFTNHVGHFILVTGLLDVLAPSGRVVILSSEAHRQAPRGGIVFDDLGAERSYAAWTVYGQSKLANILFARELARRFEGTGRVAIAVHPGVIHTNLGRHSGGWVPYAAAIVSPLVLKNVPEGTATEVYAAVHPEAAGLSGKYLASCNVARPRAEAEDAALAKRLWAVTEEIVARV